MLNDFMNLSLLVFIMTPSTRFAYTTFELVMVSIKLAARRFTAGSYWEQFSFDQ
jgi:hypothetical protein